jgi:hypothetical protein
MSELTYKDVLELLTEKARAGSVSALVVLERALRTGDDEDPRVEVGEAIDRILSDGD